jgi:hypothetical protein
MSRPGWNQHGWWIGPADAEPEKRPPRARCNGPQVCVICGPTVTTWAPDPNGLPITPCKYCHEAIVWAETMPNPRARTQKPAKWIPFDAEPSEFGKWALTPRRGQRPLCGEMDAMKAAAFRAAGQRTFQKHVKTCPKVTDWPKGEFLVKHQAKR